MYVLRMSFVRHGFVQKASEFYVLKKTSFWIMSPLYIYIYIFFWKDIFCIFIKEFNILKYLHSVHYGCIKNVFCTLQIRLKGVRIVCLKDSLLKHICIFLQGYILCGKKKKKNTEYCETWCRNNTNVTKFLCQRYLFV